MSDMDFREIARKEILAKRVKLDLWSQAEGMGGDPATNYVDLRARGLFKDALSTAELDREALAQAIEELETGELDQEAWERAESMPGNPEVSYLFTRVESLRASAMESRRELEIKTIGPPPSIIPAVPVKEKVELESPIRRETRPELEKKETNPPSPIIPAVPVKERVELESSIRRESRPEPKKIPTPTRAPEPTATVWEPAAPVEEREREWTWPNVFLALSFTCAVIGTSIYQLARIIKENSPPTAAVEAVSVKEEAKRLFAKTLAYMDGQKKLDARVMNIRMVSADKKLAMCTSFQVGDEDMVVAVADEIETVRLSKEEGERFCPLEHKVDLGGLDLLSLKDEALKRKGKEVETVPENENGERPVQVNAGILADLRKGREGSWALRGVLNILAEKRSNKDFPWRSTLLIELLESESGSSSGKLCVLLIKKDATPQDVKLRALFDLDPSEEKVTLDEMTPLLIDPPESCREGRAGVVLYRGGE